MALSTQEQTGLTAMQTAKVNTGAAYGKTDFWCVACIVNGANAVTRISSCFPAGKSGGGTYPSWFWGVKGHNEYSSNDSECKVLNDLECLTGGTIATAGNRLVMYGDHGPCGSCKKVLAAFRAYYAIPASVLYVQDVETIKSATWPNGTQYGWSDAVKEGNVWARRF